jgi:hypothetical protein
VPFTKAVLNLKGGKGGGLFVNSKNLCKTTNQAIVKMTGQNGKEHNSKPRIATSCG